MRGEIQLQPGGGGGCQDGQCQDGQQDSGGGEAAAAQHVGSGGEGQDPGGDRRGAEEMEGGPDVVRTHGSSLLSVRQWRAVLARPVDAQVTTIRFYRRAL